MRLFVAVYPPAEACDHLAQGLAGLRVTAAADRGVNMRLARRDTWHVTLVFLGEVAEQRAADVNDAVRRAVDGWRADAAGGLELRLAGGGRFGRGKFTVLWVGLDGARGALERLSRGIRRELKRARLPYDNRRFNPHLTVARPGDRLDRADVEADRDVLADYRGPAWPVETVELVSSHLGPKPTYEHLAGWRLT
jgi:2'-5' RNA ligase